MIHLKAGLIRLQFDPDSAFLRRLSSGNHEIVRGVFAAIRDQNWDTIPSRIFNLKAVQEDGGFTLTFDALAEQGDISFAWQGRIHGRADSRVSYELDGLAQSTFLKNRIGLCVLHPIRECAGTACTVMHTNGSQTVSNFPETIAPHQPFRDLASVTHAVEPGVAACVAFEGEAFEMEDQRNWTDASFKTYSTPLDLPFPVKMNPGDRVRHVVTIELRGQPRHHVPSEALNQPDAISCTARWSDSIAIPPIGLQVGTLCRDSLTESVVSGLTALSPAHLRVDVRPQTDHWREELGAASQLAKQVGAALELGITLSDDGPQELEAIREQLENLNTSMVHLLIYSHGQKVTSAEHVQLAEKLLPTFNPDSRIAIGTDAYFAEFNRHRPNSMARLASCYSMNPQVHAFDKLSLVETLEAQSATVHSAFHIRPRPVVVSPITLRPRFNPNATEVCENVEPEVDARQPTSFAAAWTVGSLAELATLSQIGSLTYYEIAGSRGVMAADGTLWPVFGVFAAMSDWQRISPVHSSDQLAVAGLALSRHDGQRRLVITSLFPEGRELRIELGPGKISRVLRLDQEADNPSAGRTVSDWRTSVHGLDMLLRSGFQPTEDFSCQDGFFHAPCPPEGVLIVDFDVSKTLTAAGCDE